MILNHQASLLKTMLGPQMNESKNISSVIISTYNKHCCFPSLFDFSSCQFSLMVGYFCIFSNYPQMFPVFGMFLEKLEVWRLTSHISNIDCQLWWLMSIQIPFLVFGSAFHSFKMLILWRCPFPVLPWMVYGILMSCPIHQVFHIWNLILSNV